MLQELSEAVKAYVQAQMEENKRFWTYLQHLEAQKHQFVLFIKSKDANFPELLLQQYNFRDIEEAAPTNRSEDAKAVEEAKEESKEEEQQEQKAAEDAEAVEESKDKEQEAKEEYAKEEEIEAKPSNVTHT